VISAENNFFVYRRFAYCHTRIITQKAVVCFSNNFLRSCVFLTKYFGQTNTGSFLTAIGRPISVDKNSPFVVHCTFL